MAIYTRAPMHEEPHEPQPVLHPALTPETGDIVEASAVAPGAGGTVAALVILHQHLLFVRPGVEENLAFARAAALGIPLVSLIVGIGMISSLPYVHFTNQVLRARRGFGSLVKIVLPVTILVWWPQEVLAIGFVLYSLSGPALWLWRKRAHTSLATTATTATTPS